MDSGGQRWTRSAVVSGGMALMLLAILQDSPARQPGAPRAAWRKAPSVHERGAVRGNALWVSAQSPSAHELAVEQLEADRLLPDATPAERHAAVVRWYHDFFKSAQAGPDPRAAQRLALRERGLLDQAATRARIRPSALLEPFSLTGDFGQSEFLGAPMKSVLAVMVRFAPPGGSETFTRSVPVNRADPSLGCTTLQETRGPLDFGADPPPGPADNFLFYKANLGIEDYRSLFFGTGPSAGYGVVRPDLGGVDLSGLSLNDYLLEMSRGTYSAGGDILPAPVAVPHSSEYYNSANYRADSLGRCRNFGFTTDLYGEFVESTLNEVTAAYDGVLDFSRFDANGDQIVDLFVIIHAGYASQMGGENRLATLSLGFALPRQIAGFGTPDDASDDYFVEGFNLNPEQLDLGGVQEEFEHQLGLPDLYASDLNNSNAWWGAHSNGVWGGPLGATRPMGHNLWQDWILGWRQPLIIDYDDPRLLSGKLTVEVGRARNTPAGTEDGVIIRLPDAQSVIANLAGGASGWYSASGNSLDHRVESELDLSAATAPITFSFASSWDIEPDFDYGLLELSLDGGATWFTLPDTSRFSTDQDPNSVGVTAPGEAWALTGQGRGTVVYDLSPYAGRSLRVRFRYLTDASAVNAGWQVDDLSLSDASGVLYTNDLETGFNGWTNTGWLGTPHVTRYPRYYTLEWRDDSGYDASFRDAYRYAYASGRDQQPPQRVVDRLPYTTPGLVIAYRDTRQEFDFLLGDDLFTGDSIGPKYGHLVVDSHPSPLRFDTPDPSQAGLVGINLPQANLMGDAAFGSTPTEPWTARLDFDPLTGNSSEIKSWPSQAPVSAFHDSYGYYPGVFPAPDGTFRFHSVDASAVLPAKQAYSTRVSDVDGEPMPELHGTTYNGFVLGSGNPGDDQAQYGVHVQVASNDATRATIEIWNRLFEVKFRSQVTSAPGAAHTFAGEVLENIGGRLLAPVIVLELPAALEYVEGSAFGGLVPADPSLTSSQAIADQLHRGISVAKTTPGPVRFLVWSADALATQAGVPELGFRFERAGAAADPIAVQFFKNGNEPFQSESVPY
jgi:immune inhibitor A